jgi:Protein of unknown function (DUF4238)
MTARQHHYVPRCYLKGFVANRNKPKLFVVDLKERRSFSTNPINVGAERDFHRIVVDGHRPDALEMRFPSLKRSSIRHSGALLPLALLAMRTTARCF